MSAIRPPAKPRAPSFPRQPALPTSAPKLPDPAKPAQVIANRYEQPPQWPGSDLEWICWKSLIDLGHKIFGRPDVEGKVDDPMEADWYWQPAIVAPGLNTAKDFYRADFASTTWGKVQPPTGYDRGILLDPRGLFTHPDPGKDRMHRSILAAEGWRLVFLDDVDLYNRPMEVIRLAIRGVDVSRR